MLLLMGLYVIVIVEDGTGGGKINANFFNPDIIKNPDVHVPVNVNPEYGKELSPCSISMKSYSTSIL